MDVNPENTQSKFKVKLREMIRLQGDWECALSEIHYPNAFYNVPECSFQYNLGSDEWHVGKMTQGQYKYSNVFVKTLNNVLQNKLIVFLFDELTQKIHINLSPGCQLKLDNNLSMILGFDKGETLPPKNDSSSFNIIRLSEFNTVYALRVIDLNRGWYNFFVYSDVVESSVVGDVQANLLRIVNISGNRGDIINTVFLNPYYIPISKNYFSQIDISLCRDTGEYLDFLKGKVILILHFRRKSLF
jgi:hypothetical protein